MNSAEHITSIPPKKNISGMVRIKYIELHTQQLLCPVLPATQVPNEHVRLIKYKKILKVYDFSVVYSFVIPCSLPVLFFLLLFLLEHHVSRGYGRTTEGLPWEVC